MAVNRCLGGIGNCFDFAFSVGVKVTANLYRSAFLSDLFRSSKILIISLSKLSKIFESSVT